MILPDVNILLYAYDKGSRFHSPAAAWLEAILSEKQVALSWQTITGFIRIFTHPSILKNPVTIEQAVGIVRRWLELDNVHLVFLDKKNWPEFADVLVESGATGNLVMDAHLAAMATSCGARLATTDRDFRRFSGIRIFDPLKG
jgi:toxin-antitoxin system PIN domain toxin